MFLLLIFISAFSNDSSDLVEADEDIEPTQSIDKDKYKTTSPLCDYEINVDTLQNFEGLDIKFEKIYLASDNDNNYIGFDISMKNLSHDVFETYPGQMEIYLSN